MRLVLKPWFIKQKYGEQAVDTTTEDIIKKFSIVHDIKEKSLGVLYGATPKAVKFITKSIYHGGDVFAYVPQKAVVLIDDTQPIERQAKEYLCKIKRDVKNLVLEEVQHFVKTANIVHIWARE